MTAREKPVFNLDARRNPIAGTIEINGERHDVRKYTGVQYEQVAQFTPETKAPALYKIVEQVVPTLTHDVVQTFDADICSWIMLLASQGIVAVEELFPNVESPATSTSPG